MDRVRLERRDRRAVADLVDFLERRSDVPVLDVVTRTLPALVGAEMGCSYRPGVALTGSYLDFVHVHGAPEPFVTLLDRYSRRAPTRLFTGTFDALHPSATDRNKAVLATGLFDDREAMERLPFMQECLRPAGIADYQHLRALICDGSLLLGWVGVLGTGVYGPREHAILDAIIQPLKKRMRLDKRLRDAGVNASAVETIIEALPGAAFIVRDDDVVVHANATGRALLDADVIELQERLRTQGAGHQNGGIEIHAFAGEENRNYRLVVIDAPRMDRDARLAMVERLWRLTPRQRQVLALVVAGDANKTIAERLRCAVVTIEVHVTALLRKAGVDGRAALVAKFWTLNP